MVWVCRWVCSISFRGTYVRLITYVLVPASIVHAIVIVVNSAVVIVADCHCCLLLLFYTIQTWEYAPTYAIRTYAFISPFWVFGWVLHNVLHLDKVLVFYAIRMLLATVASFSESCFVAATFATYGESLGILTALFTLFSSGILYAATAFLPSAVIMSIVMLALSAWMRRRYELTIFCGCVAVLWSGWPFVGVLFVPLGLHMLWDTYTHNRGGVLAVARLAAIGVVILIVTGVSAGIIDVYCYGKKYVNWLLV